MSDIETLQKEVERLELRARLAEDDAIEKRSLYRLQEFEVEELKKQIAEYACQLTEAREAIVWALGYHDFPVCPKGKQYCWRTELRERSGMTNEEIEAIAKLSD